MRAAPEAASAKGEIPLPAIDPDPPLEEKDLPPAGRPPRNWLRLVLGAVVAAGVAAALIFLFTSSKEQGVGGREESPVPLSDSGQLPGSARGPDTRIRPEAGSEPLSPDADSFEAPRVPAVALSADADDFDLESLVLPPLPYCIYMGAHKEFQEAATTQSELESNYLPAYIVPIRIKGNVAQSLFGVTQDGLWYRVLTGHFRSKEDARETLGMMMSELPGYQPEILRFPYTVECGRFLDANRARLLSEKLDQKDVFNYSQTYPTSDGRTLTRILVGCFFSERGAEDQAARLEEKGFSCTVTDR